MDKRNIFQVAVQNSYTATPVALAGGKMSCAQTTGNVGWGASLRTSWGESYTKTAYAAGTAGAWTFTFPATPTASTSYFITVFFPNAQTLPTGGQETNALFYTRTYEVYTDQSGETGTTLAAKFVAKITADLSAKGTAANVGAVLTFTQTAASVANLDGLATMSASSDVAIVNTVAQVLPSGTPAIVNMIAGAGLATGTQYTTYDIVAYHPTTNPIAEGNFALMKKRFIIFLEQNDADFAAAATLIDAILAGTSTAANYLGID